jgi:ABC-type phosphate transport system substrate-binding protein
MSGLSTRRLASTCALSMALAVFAVPGVASAKGKKGVSKPKCSSELAINGEGSSAQKAAQRLVWIPGFETSSNPAACSGTQGSGDKPKVTYQPEGSGAGLKAFGAEGESIFHGKTVQYAGTDEAPNSTQKSEIEAHGLGITQKPTLATLPVTQFAVAMIVNLPSGCTATSAAAPGRLALQNKTLYQLWIGHIHTWGELISMETSESKGKDANKDEIKGTDCLAEKIKHVVRLDQSGTTHTFKRFLNLISEEKVPFESAGHVSEGEENFGETAEGAKNTSWPAGDEVLRPAAKGGGEEAKLVLNTPSSIGYVNLAEARTEEGATTKEKFVPASVEKPGVGGANTESFWAEVQNTGTPSETESGKGQKYADPSSNGDVDAKAESNCAGEKFTNGKSEKFPPKSVFDTWNTVTSNTKQKAYTLCGLTYDLEVAYENAFEQPPAVGQATTAENYLSYVLNEEAGGGQKLIDNEQDYFEIGAKLDKESKAGLAELFEEE